MIEGSTSTAKMKPPDFTGSASGPKTKRAPSIEKSKIRVTKPFIASKTKRKGPDHPKAGTPSTSSAKINCRPSPQASKRQSGRRRFSATSHAMVKNAKIPTKLTALCMGTFRSRSPRGVQP